MNGLVPAELLRGICMEATAVRLGRTAPPPEPTHSPQLEATERRTPEEDALQRGYDAGWQQGHEEGIEAGHEEGMRRGLEEAITQNRAAAERAISEARMPLQKQEERLRGLASALEDCVANCCATLEDDLVALCYEAICQVLGATAVSVDVVRSHAAHVVSTWSSTSPIEVHVHPEDADLLQGSRTAPGSERWTCVADPEVTLGGCILVSRGGGLDARLESALDTCKAALVEHRARRRSSSGVEP